MAPVRVGDIRLVRSVRRRLGGARGCLAEVPELERSTDLRHNGVDVNVS